MRTYIVLLRGINVSGQKKIKMADLRQMLTDLGFKEVATYIQSGNIALKDEETDTITVARKIKKGISDTYGFEVPVLVKTFDDLHGIFERNPFKDAQTLETNSIYFVLLAGKPKSDLVAALNREVYANEKFFIGNDCVYLSCAKGYGNAKLDNNLIERKLKVSATTRNYRTMVKLLEMAKE